MEMMEMLKEMFIDGYRFVYSSYYGDSEVEDFEEVEEAYEEAEEEEFLQFGYDVRKADRVVVFWVEDEE